MAGDVIKGHDELREAYRDELVAQKYVERRFREPLGALLHARQVGVVRDAIRRYGIRRAVEIAPGPARVTVDVVSALEHVTLVDASAQMLEEAKCRLGERGLLGRTCLVQGDAFRLPLRAHAELIYSFRLVRHFELGDRRRLYAQLASILNPGGLLIFDAVNALVSKPLRAGAASGEYEHHDALLTECEIRSELQASGFSILTLRGVQHRYSWLRLSQVYLAPRSKPIARAAMEVFDRLGGPPLEWVVVCRRK